MASLKPLPVTTSTHANGTGVWITRSSPDANGTPGEAQTVSRWSVQDPDTLTRDVGWPTYQFRMVRNYNEGAGDTEPSHAALLHCHKIQKILIVPARLDGDVTASRAWVETYLDLSAVPEEGTALAAIPVKDPNPAASPIEIVTTVVSLPTGSDRLGVQVFSREKTGHVAPAAPTISGAALGFSGAELTDWRWKGFVAERTEEDPDVIRVFAGLEKLVARNGIGDLSKTANYVFSVRESDGALVAAAAEVVIDIPFIPSQMVTGRPIVLKGGERTISWVIGRADPEWSNPQLVADDRPTGVELAAGVASAGGLGIWSPTDTTWENWRRIRQLATGVSHAPTHHLDNGSVEHKEVPRDVGLSYQQVSQTLTPHTIDTDSGQDPLVKMGKKAILNQVPD